MNSRQDYQNADRLLAAFNPFEQHSVIAGSFPVPGRIRLAVQLAGSWGDILGWS